MANQIKRIAIITSGGDSQGMNVAVRAVVLAARQYGIEVVGIMDGYYGMTHKRPGDYRILHAEDVEDIINRGGTVLNSARFEEFIDPEIVKRAAKNLEDENIGALVICGGDGSFRGGLDILKHGNIPCIGIPCTIDNDMTSTEYTLGFDSALRTSIDLADCLRDTCNSHKRCNVIEVMGRACGQIALHTAIAVGATAVSVPESPEEFDADETIEKMIEARKNGKRSFLVVFAEGAEDLKTTKESKEAAVKAAIADFEAGKIDEKKLAKTLNSNVTASFGEQFVDMLQSRSKAAFAKYYEETGNLDFKGEYIETKFARYAHTARGGRPSPRDRVIASKMGELAVDLLAAGKGNRVVCVHDGDVTSMDMVEAIHVDSVYRKYRKTGVEDAEAIAALIPLQQKLYRHRFEDNAALIKAVKALSEV